MSRSRVFFAFILISGSNSEEAFGPYSLEYKDIKLCNNSTMSDKQAIFELTRKPTEPDSVFIFNLTLLVPKLFEEVTITFYTLKNGRRKQIVYKKIKNPCDNYVNQIPSLQKIIKLAKNCVIPKGIHIFELNFPEVTRLVWGSQFYYGEYTTRAAVISRKKFLACFTITTIIHPKDNASGHNKEGLKNN